MNKDLKYPDDYVNKILCGDCLEVMKGIPDNSIDLLVTDPPYFLPNTQFRPEMRLASRMWSNFSFAQTAFEQYLKLFLLKAKEDFEFYLFTDEVSYPVVYPILYSHFYQSKLIVWNKKSIGLGGKWRRQFELIIYSFRGKPKRNGSHADILDCKRVRNKEHPYEKPIEVVKQIIELSHSDLVLDPFLGIGTTAVACKQLNRRFIGIEINPDYCKIARKRLMESG